MSANCLLVTFQAQEREESKKWLQEERVKGKKDWQKYEKARKQHRFIDKPRVDYTEDWKNKEMKIIKKR